MAGSSSLFAGIDAALSDALSVAGQTFSWQGNDYTCILNAEGNTLVTSKSLFANNGFPKWGDIVYVAGRRWQVNALANGGLELFPGGLESRGTDFVNDPENPSLVIGFGSLVSG